MVNQYIRCVPQIPRTFTFSLSQNLISPSQALLARRPVPNESEEGPEVLRPRLVASQSEAAVQVRGGLSGHRAGKGQESGLQTEGGGESCACLPSGFLPRSWLAAVPVTIGHLPSTSGRGQASSGPQTPTTPRPGWTLLSGRPRRGRWVSEGLRRLAPPLGSLTLGKSQK